MLTRPSEIPSSIPEEIQSSVPLVIQSSVPLVWGALSRSHRATYEIATTVQIAVSLEPVVLAVGREVCWILRPTLLCLLNWFQFGLITLMLAQLAPQFNCSAAFNLPRPAQTLTHPHCK